MEAAKNITNTGKVISLILLGKSEEALKLIVIKDFFNSPKLEQVQLVLESIDYLKYCKTYPNSKSTFDRIIGITSLYSVQKKVRVLQESLFKTIQENHYSKHLSLKALFFFCRIDKLDYFESMFELPVKESLEAVKLIYNRLPDSGNKDLDINACDALFNLLFATIDLINIQRNYDLLIDSHYEMKEISEIEFEISQPDRSLRLELWKQELERRIRIKEAEDDVSKEEYIKHIDQYYKTAEGMPGIIHSPGVKIIEKTKGLSALEVRDEAFEKMTSKNEKERLEGLTEVSILYFKACFHSIIREILKSIYNPALKINIKYHIKVKEGVSFTVYELLQIMAAIIAKIELDQTYESALQSGLSRMKQYRQKENPEISDREFKARCLATYCHHFISNQNIHSQEYMLELSLNDIIKLVKNVKDLENRSDLEIESAIDFISEVNLPYNLLYKTGKTYSGFIYKDFGSQLPRMFYDYFVTDKMFSHKTGDKDNKKKGANSDTRESNMCLYLKTLFMKVATNVAISVPIPESMFGEYNGEKDFFAYSENENVLFYAEVKLSNTFARKPKRKKEWVDNNVYGSGKRQINNLLSIAKTKNGLDYIGNQLKVADLAKRKPKIHAFLICDCYYSDHLKINLPGDLGSFTVVNIFEIENLLRGSTIHQNQKIEIAPLQQGNLKKLIDLLERNIFWQFLNDYSDNPFEMFEIRSINESVKVKTLI